MKTYILILFVVGATSGDIEPSIMEMKFSSMIECWSTGFSMKERNPKRIVWFSCEADPWM